MRAAVADLVPPARRGTAYGVFGAVYGLAWFVGGAGTGALYQWSIPGTVLVVGAIQLAALTVLVLQHRSKL
jgi:MFS family permease